MSRATAWTLAILLVLIGIGFGGWRIYSWLANDVAGEGCLLTREGDEKLHLTTQQAANAAIIVAASYKRNLPEQAAVIALATAWQESGLRNLNYGDRDSLGLFQQRPSQGWGTEAEIMDPWYSAERFYKELVKFKNWETTDVNDIAQKVQRSGHPEAYRKHETNARALAGALRGSRPGTLTCKGTPDSGPAPDTLTPLLDAVKITHSTTGNTLTMTSADAGTLWAAAHMAVATAGQSGATSVTVENRRWQPDSKGWRDTREPAPEGTAIVKMG